MACKYWYDGAFRTEEEFKSILENGLLDQLIRDNIVVLDKFEIDETKIKNAAKKEPVSLRVLRKIDSNINNRIDPNSGKHIFQNPLDAVKDFNKQQKLKKKDLTLKFAIKVRDKIYTGEGKENEALAQELNETAVRQSGLSVRDSLQEGAVYMLVPSSYGLYPIKVFNNKVKDTKIFGDVLRMLKNLKTNDPGKIIESSGFFKENFYRLTAKDDRTPGVSYNEKTDSYFITRFDPNIKDFATKEFKTAEEARDFLGDLLYRVDYTKINKGNYNVKIAENNAVKTDVFVEQGSFFHSPSLVIQAYTMSDEDMKNQQKTLDLFVPTDTFNNSETKSQEANTNTKNKSQETEGKLYNAPVTSVKELAGKEKKEEVIEYTPKGKAKQSYTVKGTKIFNSKGNEVFKNDSKDRRAIYAKLAVREGRAIILTHKGKQYIVNNKGDIFSTATKDIMKWGPENGERKAIIEEYNKRKQPKTETKTEVKEKPEGPPGLSLISQIQPEEEMQDLSDIIPGAIEQGGKLEKKITYTEDSSKWDDFDLGLGSDDFNREKPDDPKKKTKDLEKKIEAFGWTKQQEIDWLIDMLGTVFLKGTKGKKRGIKIFDTFEKLKEYLPKESYEQLLEARKNGEELYGLFTNAAVLISQNAPAGVIFHEAFHVVFNLILPLDKRITLIAEAFEKYKDELPNIDTGKKDADGNPIMRLPNFLEVEELLADKFMEYTISLEKSKTGIKGLDRTFKGMNRMFKAFFSPDGMSIDGIFMDINLGRYVDQVQFKDTVLSRSIRQKSDSSEQATNPERKFLDPLAEKESLEYMTTLFDEVMEAANKQLDPEGTRNLKNTEIIREYGFDRILANITTRAWLEYQHNSKKSPDKQIQNPEEQLLFLNVLTNNQKSLDMDFLKERKIARFKEVNDYVRRFAIYLQRKGIYIKLDGTSEIGNLTDSTDYENIDSLSELETGEETSDSVAMRANVEIDPRETMGEKLKNLFASFPKYKSNRKNSKAIVNRYGVTSKEDPGTIFNYLIKEISKSYRMKDMEAKIAKINRPWVRLLQEAMENDPNIRTLLWANIGSKHYAVYNAILEDNGKYSYFTSNRKKVNDIIKEELISNFLVTDSPVFNKVNNKVDFDNLNIEYITEQNRDFKGMLDFFNNSSDPTTNRPAPKNNPEFWENVSEREEFFSDVVNPLNNLGINITTDDLLAIFDPNESRDIIKYSVRRISDLLETFQKVLNALEGGDNIFTTSIPSSVVSREERREGRTLLETLAKQLEPVLSKEVVSSFVGIGGKAKYNLINSGHINKEIDKLTNPERFEEYLENISEDPFMSKLPILEDLKDDSLGLQRVLSEFILDGFTRRGKVRSADYSSMSDIELAATDMAFYDRENSPSEASFRLSMPSDSPTTFYLNALKLNKAEIIERVLQTAKAESARIALVKNLSEDSKLPFVKNYLKNGTKFKILTFLNETFEDSEGNTINLVENFNEELALQRIEEFFSEDITKEGFFKNEIEKFREKGIIKSVNEKTGVIEFADNVIDTKIKNKTDFFKQYLLNHFYYNTQFNSLLNRDAAFYKNPVDQQKRGKQQVSPGIYPALEGTYKAMIIKDGIVASRDSFVNYVFDKIEEATTMTESEKKALKIVWASKSEEMLKEKPKEFTGNNISDGATWVSIEHRRKFLEGLGRLGEAERKALDNIEKQIESIEDLMLINSPTKPEKPFDVSSYILEGVEIPFQAKNAEIVLTPSLALKKDSSGKYVNPKLAAAYMDLNGPNKKFDVLYPESAIKVGGLGIGVDSKQNVIFADYEYDAASGSYSLPDVKLINTPSGFLELNWSDLRLQQETPEHYTDDRSNFGTQLRNLILSDISMEEDYVLQGFDKPFTGEQLVQMYQDLVVQNLKESFEEVRKDFENEDGTINYSFLVQKLREEIIDREMGNEYLEALAPVQEVLGNNGSNTALPLYHPMIAYKMESLMNSFFKNRVTKQKIKGGQLVNAPSWGFSEQLEVIEDPKTGGIIFEALIPWTSRKLFPTNKDGEVDIEAIQKHAPELLDIVANRIPTEDKYSMFSIRIKGFTPQSMGGVIIMPPEALTISGFDFDIDKLFFMSREFNIDKDGNPKVVKYYEVSKKEDLEDIAKNIFSNYRDLKRFLDKTDFTEDYIQGILDLRKQGLDQRSQTIKGKEETYNSEEHKKIMLQIKAKKYAKANTDNKANIANYQKEIDELYSKMEEDFLPFNEEITKIEGVFRKIVDEIKEKIVELNMSSLDFNGKRARNNQLVTIIEGILRSKHTAASILQIADTSPLKERGARLDLLKAGLEKEANTLKGKELIERAEEVKSQDQNINYPSSQLDFFRANMDGKKLIGPFANHNTHHAKAQFTDLRLRDSVRINGKEYQDLNQAEVDGVRISRILATNLAAIVDNTKDPIANALNMNGFTIDVIAFQNRLGVPEDFTYALLNQPSMLNLTQKYFNEQGSMSEDKQISSTKAYWASLLKEKLLATGEDIQDFNDLELTTELLEKHIYPNDSTEYYVVQLKAIQFFTDQKAYALELSKGVQAGKVDTQGVGPSSANNFVLLEKQKLIIDGEVEETSLIEGLDEIFMPRVSGQSMIPAFNEYGIRRPSNIMNKIFPYYGTVETMEEENNDTVYSALGHIKRKMGANKKSGVLTEKEASMVDIQFMNFVSSAFPFFRYSENKDMILNFPQEFKKFKNSLAKDSPLRILFDQIYIVEPDGYSLIPRLEYYNTGKNSVDHYFVRQTWERMLIDPNPDIKEFAFKLIKYTFFANGLGYGAKSFSNLIPVKFFTDEYQVKNNIVDSKGNTYNQFLQQSLYSEKFEAGQSKFAKRFYDQFYRNFATAEGFVKSVKVKKGSIPEGSVRGLDATQIERLETLTAAESKEGAVITSNGNLVVNRRKNFDLITEFNNGEPVEYIKVFRRARYSEFGNKIPDPYRVDIYKLDKSSLQSGIKDPSKFDGKTGLSTYTYTPVSNLGLSNISLEYNFAEDIDNTALALAPKIEKKSVANYIKESQMSEEEAIALMQQEEAMSTTVPISITEIKNKTEQDYEKGLAALEKINTNKDNIELTEDEQFYVHKTKKDSEGNPIKYERVTSFITDSKKIPDSPLIKSATTIGTKLDGFIRDFFEKPPFEIEDFIKDYDFAPKEDLIRTAANLTRIKETMDSRGEKVFANDMLLAVENFQGTGRNVAGTVDLISIDKDGIIRIYDVKTMRGNQFVDVHKSGINKGKTKYNHRYSETELSNYEKHQRQLSTYALLLEQSEGVSAKHIGVLPFEISYEPGETSTTVLIPLKGVSFRKLNIEEVLEQPSKEVTKEKKEVKDPLAALKSIDPTLTEKASSSYQQYLQEFNSLDKSKQKDKFITEEEFNSYPPEKQKTVLQQIKNC